MKIVFVITCLVTITALALVAEVFAGGPGFEPVLIERTRSVSVNAGSDRVCDLLLPGNDEPWHTRHPRRELFALSPGDDAGSVSLMTTHEHGVFVVLADVRSDPWLVRTVHLYPGIELLVSELRCAADGKETKVSVTWKVMGISAEGNEAVEAFMSGAQALTFESQVDAIATSIESYLGGGTN